MHGTSKQPAISNVMFVSLRNLVNHTQISDPTTMIITSWSNLSRRWELHKMIINTRAWWLDFFGLNILTWIIPLSWKLASLFVYFYFLISWGDLAPGFQIWAFPIVPLCQEALGKFYKEWCLEYLSLRNCRRWHKVGFLGQIIKKIQSSNICYSFIS